MEIDSMFLLDTNPLLKFLIFEGGKMCVNVFLKEEKKWGIPHAFSSVVGTTVQVL